MNACEAAMVYSAGKFQDMGSGETATLS